LYVVRFDTLLGLGDVYMVALSAKIIPQFFVIWWKLQT